MEQTSKKKTSKPYSPKFRERAVRLAAGQTQMRKVDGWETLSQPLNPMTLDLAA